MKHVTCNIWKYGVSRIMLLACALVIVVPLITPHIVHAQTAFPRLLPTPTGSCPTPAQCNVNTGYCQGGGQAGESKLQCNYSLCDFLQLFVNAMNIILYLFGGVALVLLVWGGIGFIMSAGSEEKVTASKDLIKNTVIGIVIILVAYQLVAIFMGFLTVDPAQGQRRSYFVLPWHLGGNVRTLCTDSNEAFVPRSDEVIRREENNR